MKSWRASALTVLLVAGAASAAVAMLAPAASSAAPIQSGGGALALGPPTVLVFKQVGSDIFTIQQGSLTLGGTVTPSGTVTGVGTITVTELIHPDGISDLSATFVCDACTVGATTGKVVGQFVGEDMHEVTFGGSFVLAGEGSLAGFVGAGKFTGSDLTGDGSYTLTFHA